MITGKSVQVCDARSRPRSPHKHTQGHTYTVAYLVRVRPFVGRDLHPDRETVDAQVPIEANCTFDSESVADVAAAVIAVVQGVCTAAFGDGILDHLPPRGTHAERRERARLLLLLLPPGCMVWRWRRRWDLIFQWRCHRAHRWCFCAHQHRAPPHSPPLSPSLSLSLFSLSLPLSFTKK